MPPSVPSVAQELYKRVEFIAQEDEAMGWALLYYMEALGLMIQEVDDLAGETDEGVGWSQLVDVNRTPRKALPWLAQFKGVTLPDSADEATQRSLIVNAGGFDRGKPSALVAAIQAQLTGTKTVVLRERDTSAYHFFVATKVSETPSTSAVIAAINEAKPGGLQYTYTTYTGSDYATLLANYATYQAIYTAFVTYQGVLTNTPGT